MAKIMGVDGALANTGIALLNEEDRRVEHLVKLQTSKCKTTPDEPSRLKRIYGEFSFLLIHLAPDIVVMENQYVGQNPKTSLLLARVRGIVELACGIYGVPFCTIEPLQIKQVTTGKGNAKKEEVQNSIVALYAEDVNVKAFLSEVIPTGKNKTDDLADALAIAHTYSLDPSIAITA